MTDIMTSDVMRFIEWVTAMPVEVYHLARPLLHGVCRLHEIAEAKRITRDYPTHAAHYDFIGVLAGGNEGELEALKEEATRELVADFYAAHPRWISVEDRLPGIWAEIWVSDGNYVDIGYMGTTRWHRSGSVADGVTHWAEIDYPALPEAPG